VRRMLAALVLLAAACDSAQRRDAASVVAAVERFRVADLPSTPAAVDALTKTPCASQETCDARDVWARAGAATARSLVLKDEVGKTIAAVESGALPRESPEAQGLSKKLDEAEAALKAGHDGLPACDERVQALKRKYRL